MLRRFKYNNNTQYVRSSSKVTERDPKVTIQVKTNLSSRHIGQNIAFIDNSKTLNVQIVYRHY